MHRYHFAISASFAIGLLFVGGCTTTKPPINATTYAAYAEGLKGSPAFRQAEISKCIGEVSNDPRRREVLRKIANVAPGTDPRPIVCQRLTGAMASGRLTYAEMQTFTAGQATPKIVRIMQGR